MSEWHVRDDPWRLALQADDGTEVLSVRPFSFVHDARRGPHDVLHIGTPGSPNHVEIIVSPQGRNIRTFVEGREVMW